MNSARITPTRVIIAGATVALAIPFLLDAASDGDAAPPTKPVVTSPVVEVDPDVEVIAGRILAAYVAPDEIVVDDGRGERRSVPVAADVRVTVESTSVGYDAFTLSFDDGRPTDGLGGVGDYTITLDAEGAVTAITR